MKKLENALESMIFASRWLQAPLFVGLIAASLLYAYKFVMELLRLFSEVREFTNEELLLGVLGLVDMTMVANLIAMVVIGGYTLFVSKLNVGAHEDRPEWLDKTTAATLKIKLAASLVGVSGIHLLKTFIEMAENQHAHGHLPDAHELTVQNWHVFWQVMIHFVFLLSSLVLSWSEYILHPPHLAHASHGKKAKDEAASEANGH